MSRGRAARRARNVAAGTWRGVRAVVGFLTSDGLIVAGGGLIAYGAAMVYEPAGVMVLGLEFGLFGWFVGGASSEPDS